ncbi:MAG: YlzJ-like family protein [Bacillota bacterium]
MILYTPIPLELVMEGSEPARRFREGAVGGVPVMIEEVSPGRGRLERVLSTDPFDYLNPALSPGNLVLYY